MCNLISCSLVSLVSQSPIRGNRVIEVGAGTHISVKSCMRMPFLQPAFHERTTPLMAYHFFSRPFDARGLCHNSSDASFSCGKATVPRTLTPLDWTSLGIPDVDRERMP